MVGGAVVVGGVVGIGLVGALIGSGMKKKRVKQ